MFRLDVYHHLVMDHQSEVKLTQILAIVRGLKVQGEATMAAIDDLRAANARAQAAIDGIAGDIQTLKDLLAAAGSGGLNAADTAEALGMATSLADRLGALDLENPPPAP